MDDEEVSTPTLPLSDTSYDHVIHHRDLTMAITFMTPGQTTVGELHGISYTCGAFVAPNFSFAGGAR